MRLFSGNSVSCLWKIGLVSFDQYLLVLLWGKGWWICLLEGRISGASLKLTFTLLVLFPPLIAHTWLGLTFCSMPPSTLFMNIFELFWQLSRNEREPTVCILDVQTKDCSAEYDSAW